LIALPEIRSSSSFGPRETFYLVFAGVAGLGLLALTVRDALDGVVGAPAVGLVVVIGLGFLVLFGGSDREERDGGPLDPGNEKASPPPDVTPADSRPGTPEEGERNGG
ncbi:MAG: hypothetical protein ABEJ46_03760, partial [Gemmatimonadota bacterium]